MPNTGGFDIILQFKKDIINDILVRVLNESLITNLHLKSPLSRRIEEPEPHTQVKVWWDKPELELDDDSISLSVDVTGGARQLVTERNLSVDGSASITRKALLTADDLGVPYLYLEPPQPLDLHLSKLKVTYKGSKWPALLSSIDLTRETTTLRPVLNTALMIPLSQLPLSYCVKSLPLCILDPHTAPMPSEWHIPITTAMMRVLKENDAVAMGLSLVETPCDHTQMTTAFPKESTSYVALTLTSRGMNTIIGQYRRRGALEGVIPSTSNEAAVNWQWEVLTIHCHEGYLSLTGTFRRNGIPSHVIADIKFSLGRDRSLTITPLALNTDTPTSETIVGSLYDVLRLILWARARNTRDGNSKEWDQLIQCFLVPGTQIEVEAPADEILIEEGTFTLLYDVPQSLKGFQAEIPSPEPKVTIIEPYIPTQATQGAPVSMQMQAQITTPSFPPYDYVWTTDLSTEPRPDRGPNMTLMGSPTPTGPGPQVYTNVHVQVIDTFGQVAEATAPARYQAQTKNKEGSSTRTSLANTKSMPVPYAEDTLTTQNPPPVRRWMKGVGCLGMVAIIAVIVIALYPHLPVSAHPPQLTVSPNSLDTQSCVHALSGMWTCNVTVGESSSSQGNIIWSASSNVGASFSPQSTTLSSGTSVPVRISHLPCQNGTLTFTGSGGAQPVNVSWSCTQQPASVSVRPTSFNQKNCFQMSNGGWTCTETITETAGSQDVTWTATSGLGDVSFTPGNGTLSVGEPTNVSIFIPATDCRNSTFSFNFTGGVPALSTPWACAPTLTPSPPPTLTLAIRPLSINANRDCSFVANSPIVANAGWTCSVSVISNSSNQGSLDWSASSSGASFNPPNGTLSSPSQVMPVTVFVSANTICPAQIDLAFQGPANTVHVPWSCASPILFIKPPSLGTGNCPAATGGGWDCTVTLADNEGGATWSASSSVSNDGVTFTPTSGTVYPGGEQVIIHVPTCLSSDTFSFAGPGNIVTSTWQCIG